MRPSKRDILDVVEAIFSFPPLVRKPVIFRLLEYLIDRFDSPPTAREIARDVLDFADFDPSLDSNVRIAVNTLRNILQKFYDEGGKQQGITLSIPKGKCTLDAVWSRIVLSQADRHEAALLMAPSLWPQYTKLFARLCSTPATVTHVAFVEEDSSDEWEYSAERREVAAAGDSDFYLTLPDLFIDFLHVVNATRLFVTSSHYASDKWMLRIFPAQSWIMQNFLLEEYDWTSRSGFYGTLQGQVERGVYKTRPEDGRLVIPRHLYGSICFEPTVMIWFNPMGSIDCCSDDVYIQIKDSLGI